MLLEGLSAHVQNQMHNVPAAVMIAELIVLDSVKHRRHDKQAAAIQTHHSTKQQRPLPAAVCEICKSYTTYMQPLANVL